MKTFGKKLYLLILLSVIFVCATLFVGCEQAEVSPQDHQHQYTQTTLTNATCTNGGKVLFSCSCGDYYQQDTSPLGHTWGEYTNTQQTHGRVCTSCGQIEQAEQHSFTYTFTTDAHTATCDVCNYCLQQVEHDFSTIVSSTNSTCTTAGTVVTKCVCGQTYTQTLPLAQHDYQPNKDENYHYNECTVCHDKTDVTAHQYVTPFTVEATCTQGGTEGLTCSCGAVQVTANTNALGHDRTNVQYSNYGNGQISHKYTCNRCGQEVVEQHTRGQEVACPDTVSRDASCCQTGHRDYVCTICEHQYHVITPQTDEHSWGQIEIINGVYHSAVCTNVDYKGNACGATQQNVQHTFEWITTTPATCTESGVSSRVCTVCGYKNGTKTIDKLGHDLTGAETIITPATCFATGTKQVICVTCGQPVQVSIAKRAHAMGQLQYDGTRHWKECTYDDCDYVNYGNHNLVEDKSQYVVPTCQTQGQKVTYCTYCGYTHTTVLVSAHNYLIDPDDYFDAPNCLQQSYHVEVCSYCNDKKVIYEGFGEHGHLTYHEKVAHTDTQDGHINYWQCDLCNKYYSTKTCTTELTYEQVFCDKAPTVTTVQTIAQLTDIAKLLEVDQTTYDYYQMTLEIGEIDIANNKLIVWDDNTDLLTLPLDTQYDVSYMDEGDTITFRFRLTNVSITVDEETLFDYQISDVVIDNYIYQESGFYSLLMSVNEDDLGELYNYVIAVVVTDQGETYMDYYDNVTYYYALAQGDKLYFVCYDNYQTILKSVVINGVAYTMTNGKTPLIDVTSNVVAQFEFCYSNEYFVDNTYKMNELDTSQGFTQQVIRCNPFVSFQYVGTNNDFGRLYANSKAKVTLNDSYITRIVITLSDDNDLEKVKDNVIKLGSTASNLSAVSYTIVNNKIILENLSANQFTILQYEASVQTRIDSIQIDYATPNTMWK